MRALVLATLGIALAIACAAAPAVVSYEYATKTATWGTVDVELAQFEATFDEDLHLLDFTPCPGVPASLCAVDQGACPPCDYASTRSCGSVPRNQSACAALCDQTLCEDIWTEIPTPASPTLPAVLFDQEVQVDPEQFAEEGAFYRVYIPEGAPFCNASLHLRVSAPWLPAESGPIMMVVFNDWIDVTTFNPRRMWPWLAGQSKTNELHVCPTDAWNYTIIDPDYFLFGFRAPRPRQPVGRWRPGTFYIYLFSLSAPTGPSYHLTVELLPIAAPQPQGLDWCAAPEVDTANYECLESDVVQWGDASTLPDEFINGDGLRYYIARVEPGPCPRFFGMSVTYSLYAFVAVWISESLAFPIADEPTEEAMLLASASQFSPGQFTMSICPTDITKPSYIHILSTPANPGIARMFTSSNPARFRATPLRDLHYPFTPLVYLERSLYFNCKNSSGDDLQLFLCPAGLNSIFDSDACNANTGNANLLPFLADPPALWPPPNYISALAAGPAFSNDNLNGLIPPVAFNNASVDPTTLRFTIATTFTAPAAGAGITAPLTSQVDVASCVPVFHHGTIVNSLLEPIQPFPAGLRATERRLECAADQFSKFVTQSEAALNQIANASTVNEVLYQIQELDYVRSQDAYQGCTQRSADLFRSGNKKAVLATHQCVQTYDNRYPQPESCCGAGVGREWATCCSPHFAEVDNPLLAPPSLEQLQGTCADASCVRTFLVDIADQLDADCGEVDVLTDFYTEKPLQFYQDCVDSVFGYNLTGKACVADSDCPAGVCDITNHKCYTAYEALVDQFLSCFVSEGGIYVALLRSSLGLSSGSVVQQLRSLYSTTDCRSDFNLEFPALAPYGEQYGPHHYQEIQLGGPACYWHVLAPFNLFSNPLDCNTDIPTVAVYFEEVPTDPSGCATVVRCNRLDVDCFSDPVDEATCDAVCGSAGFCAACFDSQSCFDLSAVDASLTDPQACAAAPGACQLANGTWAIATSSVCATIFSCTHPCWDAQAGAYRECRSAAECASAGECDDPLMENPLTGEAGACVFVPGEWFYPPCWFTLASPFFAPEWQADSLGCVKHDYSAANCTGTFVQKARTEAECVAHGCGCNTPIDLAIATKGDVHRYALPSPFASSPDECTLCYNSDGCIPLHTWTKAQWLPGSPRAVTYQNAATTAAYNLTEAFDFVGLATDLRSAFETAFVTFVANAELCRSRLTTSLQAVACACTNSSSANAEQCLSNVTLSRPLGRATVCGGVPQSLTIGLFSIGFGQSSLSIGGCVNYTFSSLSRSTFASLGGTQTLSTYFTRRVDVAIPAGSTDFVNAYQARVGNVIGNGVTIDAAQAASGVQLCAVLTSLPDADAAYDTFDWAYSPTTSDRPVPLGTGAALASGTLELCANITALRPGLYVPVVRRSDWSTHKVTRLSRGEKAVLALVAALYFIVTAFYPAVYALSVLQAHKLHALALPPFWLVLLMAAMGIIRGVYFALAASSALAQSTYVDVLLVELPTFIWFTATTLLVIFWIAFLLGTTQQGLRWRRIARTFWTLFAVFNVLMYAIFITFVVVFSTLDDKIKSQCFGRLPTTRDTSRKHVAFLVYQAFVALVAVAIALAYLVGGLWLMRASVTAGKSSKADKLKIVTIVVSVSVAAHSIFLLLLAIFQPGIPYLALILAGLELVPAAILMWALPSPSGDALSTTSSGSGSRGGKLSQSSTISDL